MKKAISIVAIFVSTIAISFGQANEFSVQMVSGFFFFSGNGVIDPAFAPNYGSVESDNPFGNKSGGAGAIAFQYQYVTSSKWIAGMQLGYQVCTSEKGISYAISSGLGAPQNFPSYYSEKANIDLTYKYVSLYPYFGRRFFNSGKFNMDLTAGFDSGICTTYGESTYGDSVSTPPMDWDVRLVVSSAFYYDHFGLLFGYAYGLSNYANGTPKINLPEGHNKIYSRMFRIGLIFRIFLAPETSSGQKK